MIQKKEQGQHSWQLVERRSLFSLDSRDPAALLAVSQTDAFRWKRAPVWLKLKVLLQQLLLLMATLTGNVSFYLVNTFSPLTKVNKLGNNDVADVHLVYVSYLVSTPVQNHQAFLSLSAASPWEPSFLGDSSKCLLVLWWRRKKTDPDPLRVGMCQPTANGIFWIITQMKAETQPPLFHFQKKHFIKSLNIHVRVKH